MSFSDRFRSLRKKKDDSPQEPPSPAPAEQVHSAAPQTPAATPKPSPTLEEVERLLAQEKSEGLARQRTMDKDISALRANIEKIELAAKNRRDSQQQTLQFLQQ